jgi:hypothetical protein
MTIGPIYDMDYMPLTNSGRPNHGCILLTSSMKEILDLLHKSRRPSRGSVTITSGLEISNFRRLTTYLHANFMSAVTVIRQTRMFRGAHILYRCQM